MWKFIAKLISGESDDEISSSFSTPGINPLSDAGYEALFLKLLQGIDQGWQPQQVLEFLGERQGDRFLYSWLKRFGQKLMASPLPQSERATQLVKLGAMNCGEVSEVARTWGEQLQQKEIRTWTATEFEEVFQQLLQGVNLGWNAAEIEQFFQQLGESGQPQIWLDWLQTYQAQVLTATPPHYELAPALKLLGEQIAPLSLWQEFSALALRFSQTLSQQQDEASIWEYRGPDIL
ncbi:MAG: hypothetical protein HC825_06905 [Oscillatoriales cyanobacterium RM1_1_9]|nr:hypothetical protein [Oscillatoriales cyanobacterium SM2_3_0]NJO47579.1 hypothetical protein [Oscillatoriales cyanobacterium RM2_1_1]NJO71480.1 hypothetical protein [Oscillatoriales cyanobacterium RM1_1_9]